LLLSSAIFQKRVDSPIRRVGPAGVLDKQVQTSNRVNDHWVVDDASLVHFIKVFHVVGILSIAFSVFLANLLDVEAEDHVRFFAQAGDATEQQYLAG
jgi:hypothetical protein